MTQKGISHFKLVALVALLYGVSVGPVFAQVTTFDFTFNFSKSLTPGANYGVLTGSFTATGGPTAYVITAMSGTLGGYSTTLLGVGAFAGNDNALTFPANPGYFTEGGVSFVANNVDYNLYYYQGNYAITPTDALNNGAQYTVKSFTKRVPGPVPGAGLWSFGGLCLGGLATRFRLCVATSAIAFRKLSAWLKRFGGASAARA